MPKVRLLKMEYQSVSVSVCFFFLHHAVSLLFALSGAKQTGIDTKTLNLTDHNENSLIVQPLLNFDDDDDDFLLLLSTVALLFYYLTKILKTLFFKEKKLEHQMFSKNPAVDFKKSEILTNFSPVFPSW